MTTTPTTHKEHTMNTTITPTPTMAQRFAAHDAQRAAERDGNFTLARVLRAASYADGFPHSYSDDVVATSRALIVAIADGDPDGNAGSLVGRMADFYANGRVLA